MDTKRPASRKRQLPRVLNDQLGSLSSKRLALLNNNKRNRASYVQPTSSASVSLCGSSTHVSSSSTATVHSASFLTFPSTYLDVGDCDQVCEFCSACFWNDERLKAFPLSHRPRYNHCCRGGRVRLHHSNQPPDSIKALFMRDDFLTNVRAYNSMFAMTSFGAVVDNSVNLRPGPYVFKVCGQICHHIGSFSPPAGQRPRFLQMYIYDTDNEVLNRLHSFGGHVESSLDERIVELLVRVLDEINELVKLFRTARDLCRSLDTPNFAIRLYNDCRERTYDAPCVGTVGAIVDESEPGATDFDIIIHTKGDVPKRVSKLHSQYMSLQYPLLFLFGEEGWSPMLRLFSTLPQERKQLTMNMYYSYLLHDRLNTYTHLLRGGRLFQQFLVDSYVCIEQNRLDYILSHQNDFRSEYLQGIHDAVIRGDSNAHDIGKRVVLPSSFTGGPRYMYKHYQDALAICQVHGNPQYFITFTCNVKWPEIVRYMLATPSLKAQDRPDIIARVFKLKVDAFINYLRSGEPFGDVTADLYTIEFQKRGLPHCHTLLWVRAPYRVKEPIEVDRYISARIPDPTSEPVLHKIVTELMLHGPCGLVKPNAPCMINAVCTKGFPKSYESVTKFDKNGYVLYKRVPNRFCVVKNGATMDDSMVVPYNRKLLLRFCAHINVECCGWNMVIKYLFKYISKGADRIRYTITSTSADVSNTSSSNFNEVQNFLDSRYICPHEAAWRIFTFPIHNRNPSVQVLAVHLENMQNVTFKETERLENIANNPSVRKTTLTEWLRSNRDDFEGRGTHLRYIDYVSLYRWDASGKCWILRRSNRTPAVGRLIYIHPSCGEAFYLRMLLAHQVGCRSFKDIRTVQGQVLPTYRSACEKLGLLANDDEWSYAIIEASVWGTSKELRSLFAHILLFCEVSDPLKLWLKHWRVMSEDVFLNIKNNTGLRPSHMNDDDLQQHVLFEMEILLNASAGSSSLCNFGLPMPRAEFASIINNRLLIEEKNYDTQRLSDEHEVLRNTLHSQQLTVYESVVQAIHQNRQILLFVYGHGGTGKTYLWVTIISALRSVGKIVLAVAASGIASLLLPSGRIAHSRFKIPLNLTDESICHVKKNTQLANLLAETSLIIWDEAPMSDRRCFESLDKTLRDILDIPSMPFGGKSVLLGGDFRQTLLVRPKASKADIISSSLPKSHLWKFFTIHVLSENMRLHKPKLSCTEKDDIKWFSSWLLDIGDGKVGAPLVDGEVDTKRIEVPSRFLIPPAEDSLEKLINFIYDKEMLANPTITRFSDKAIICPKNKTADHINEVVLAMCQGSIHSYLSSDCIQPHANDGGDTEALYPMEYLNSLCFSGFTPHCLELKVNAPIILLRNINQASGLCNGTRLLVSRLLPKVIEALVITGIAIGHRVYIPRITFVKNDADLPFVFKRKQFPIKLCYAMTINKSQGQSLSKIGVYLPEPVFSHGQLYVAFSRATSIHALKVLIVPSEGDTDVQTRNIVYSDFLHGVHRSLVRLII